MKKLILALVVLLTAALVFTGCGGNDAGGNPASSELDGVWIYSMTLEDELSIFMEEDEIEEMLSGLPEEIKNLSIPNEKAVIEGNTVSLYGNMADPSDWISAGCQGAAPESWQKFMECTYTLKGNTITLSTDGEEDITATLAADKKSFTLDEGGFAMVFKKQ